MGQVLYCFSMSFVKFQGYMGKKIDDLDPIWAFAEDDPTFNLQTAMKWYTKLWEA